MNDIKRKKQHWLRAPMAGLVALLFTGPMLAHAPLSAQNPPAYLQRVNAGGPAYSGGGANWSGDKAYSSGSWGYVSSGGTYTTPHAIANTTDDVLYQSERWGITAYRFTVPGAGRYRVDLHFAEVWFNQPGLRVFNVSLENQMVLQNLDLYAAVGHDVAVVHTFEVEVNDGILDVTFGSLVEDPKISAIAVTSVSATDATPPVISQVLAGNITASGATISWLTNEPSDSQVEYGPTTNYGSTTTLDAGLVTTHAQSLAGLAASTTYHFRVRSKDAAGNAATSTDFVFQTGSAPNSVVVLNDALSNGTLGARTGGQFVAGGGWQVTAAEDMIVFDLGRYLENGSLEIDVRNFSPGTQNTYFRHHFLSMFRNPWGNHHPAENQETVWDLHAGSYYTPGVKLLSWTYDANEVNTVVPDNWNAGQTYRLTVSWRGNQVQYFRDGVLFVTHTHSTEMQLRYLFLGRDFTVSGDLITNYRNNQYPALAGPIYANLVVRENVSAADQTPPSIQNHSVSDQYANAARVSWTTNETAVCYVEYGLTSSYGQRTPVLGPPAQTFATTLANLTPQQTYHYRIVARDETGNSTNSADRTFTTLAGGTYLFKPAADAFVEQAGLVGTTRDHANFGWANLMLSAGRECYLRFQVSGLNAPVAQTKLRLRGRQSGTTSATVRALAASWNENTVTWLSKPTPTGNTLGTLNGVSANQWQEVALSAFVAGNGTYDLALQGSGTGVASLDSRESTNFQPELIVSTAADVTPPVLANIAASNVTLNSATITWNTGEASDSQVEYGATVNYGSASPLDAALVLNHSVVLTGLAANTTYHYRVKSRDAGGNLAVSGDFVFTTLPVIPNLTLTSPNGGEWWLSGSSRTITWNASASIAGLKIELGTQAGSRWTTIASNAPNTGSYAWLVPDTVSSQASIRITDAGGSGASDVSDAVFVITRSALINFTPATNNPILTPGAPGSWDENTRERGFVMYENGTYHMWYGGWRGAYARSTPSLVDMGYATSSDGVNWTKYPGNPIQTNFWSEDFAVLKSGNTYYLYAEDEYTGDGDGARIDLYTSTNRINWTRNGTVLTRGSSAWENDEVGTPVVWKEGNTWYMLYEGLGQAFAGQVGLATSTNGSNWTRNTNNPVLTNPFGNQLDIAIDSIIKINGVYHAYAHYDTGGLNWVGGLFISRDLISWTAYPNNPMTYTSPVIVDNGTNYLMYGVVHVPAGHSQYHVSFGAGANEPPPATLTVVAPNGGENWAVGSTQTIRWNSSGNLPSVKVEYSVNNGGNWNTIVAATANDGSQDWVIPNVVSAQCLVRVSDAQDGDPNDRSDANFAISTGPDVSPPVVAILVPASNGRPLKGALAVSGSANDNTGVAKVEWQLDATNGSWTVATGTAAWSFTIPQPSEGNHTVYVRATDTATPANTSTPVTRTLVADNTAPLISNASAGGLTAASAVISWNTNEASDSQVEYGLTTSYGTLSTLDTNRVTTHAATLTGLSANTTYHYRVRSRDAAGNLATSNDLTFVTAPSAGPIFSDNFNGSTLDLNKWVIGSNSGNQSRVASSRLELRSNNSQTGWVVTKQSFSGRNTTVTVRVVQPNNDGDLGMSPTYQASSTTGTYNQANWYRFYTYRDQSNGPYLLYVQWSKNGVVNGLDVTSNLVITGAVYLRLRMDETQIHFEASLNNTAWIDTYHETFSLPGYTLDSKFYYALEAYRTPSKGVLTVDDFSITANGVLAKSGTDYASAEPMLPSSFELSLSYPNPFQQQASVRLALPEQAQVRAAIYDVTGREVRQLYHGSMPGGQTGLQWDGTNTAGQHTSNGVYFMRVIFETPAGRKEVLTRQMVLRR